MTPAKETTERQSLSTRGPICRRPWSCRCPWIDRGVLLSSSGWWTHYLRGLWTRRRGVPSDLLWPPHTRQEPVCFGVIPVERIADRQSLSTRYPICRRPWLRRCPWMNRVELLSSSDWRTHHLRGLWTRLRSVPSDLLWPPHARREPFPPNQRSPWDLSWRQLCKCTVFSTTSLVNWKFSSLLTNCWATLIQLRIWFLGGLPPLRLVRKRWYQPRWSLKPELLLSHQLRC